MATNTNITLSQVHHRAMDINILSRALVHTTNTYVTIGTTSTTVLVANTSRKCATFVNDSDEIIYLTLSEDGAILNRGIRLNAAGGSYEINVTNLYNGAVTAICTSGSKNLCVTEGYDKIKGRTTIASDGWILYVGTKTLNSNSYIRELAQTVTLVSDSYIKILGTSKTLTSDGYNKTIGTSKTLASDSYIKKSTAETTTSDSYIKTLGTSKTITSAMFIGYQGKAAPSIHQWAVLNSIYVTKTIKGWAYIVE